MNDPLVAASADDQRVVVPAEQTEAGGGLPTADVEATEEVLVLDFGGQYSQLIARRIRECGVFAELLPANADVERIRARRPQALVLSGGPARESGRVGGRGGGGRRRLLSPGAPAGGKERGAPAFPTQLLDLEIPM